VPFLYRASLNKWWFDDLYHLLFMVIGGGSPRRLVVRPRGRRRHRQRDRRSHRRRGPRAAPGADGHVQNYALGIAFGLIVMAGSYLILAGPLMAVTRHPDPVDHHLPAAGRLDRAGPCLPVTRRPRDRSRWGRRC
jgi:hypothetical protein